jgi:hypothetical protein
MINAALEKHEDEYEGKSIPEILKDMEKEKEVKDQERLKAIQQAKEALEYADAHAQEICERISAGELLLNIVEDCHLPTLRRCNQWLRQYPEFNQLYQSAIHDRLNIFEEEVLKIADDMQRDFKTIIKNGIVKRVPDPEQVQRAKLRIEVRFRHLKAMRPQRWGDVQTLKVKNEDEFDPSNFSQEELEKEIGDIERKSGIVRRNVA